MVLFEKIMQLWVTQLTVVGSHSRKPEFCPYKGNTDEANYSKSQPAHDTVAENTKD